MIKLNGTIIEFTRFPNKEMSFVFDADLAKEKANMITFKYEDDSSLIDLMMVKRELDLYVPHSVSALVISYMPYSRLDRANGSIVFTLKHIADFINGLGFDGVVIIEPHSDVTCAVIDRAAGIDFTELLFNDAISSGTIEFDPKEDFVCFPDATAQKRYGKMGDYKTVLGMKDRDFETGWINSLDIFIPNGYSIKGKNVVIVDDLCSKGGTFMLTAKALKKLGAASITLVVTHCEPTILDGDILKTDLIDKVVTSNTIVDQNKLASFDKVFIADFEEYL